MVDGRRGKPRDYKYLIMITTTIPHCFYPSKAEYLQSLRETLEYLTDAEAKVCEILFEDILEKGANSFRLTKDKYISKDGAARFHKFHFDQHAFIMILLARELYLKGMHEVAEKIYFFNKSKYHIDWFPAINIPSFMGFNHALGAIIGKFSATENSSLYFCQSCTIGSNIWFGNQVGSNFVTQDGYCHIDGHLTMLPTSQLIGSKVEGRVVLSNGSCAINEVLTDLTICFGRSPSLQKKKISEAKWQSLCAFRF